MNFCTEVWGKLIQCRKKERGRRMKKALFFVMVLALGAPVAANALSGGELYEMCHGNTADVAACTLYVRGVNDTMQVIESVNKTSFGICAPKGVTIGRMIDVAMLGVGKDPTHRDLPAPLLLSTYWQKAYPCKQK